MFGRLVCAFAVCLYVVQTYYEGTEDPRDKQVIDTVSLSLAWHV